jgi:hypothetical protein
MANIVLDPQMQSKLEASNDPVNLVDEAGEVVRVALTPEQYLRYLYKTVKVPISDEEIARRKSETGGSSLDEIWKRLGVK